MRPTVGLMPTSMFWFAGLRIEPDVSVPTFAAHRFAAVPIPELDPPTLMRPAVCRIRTVLLAWIPPRIVRVHPLAADGAVITGHWRWSTQFASSVITVFAMMTAPAFSQILMSVASYGGR